MTANARIWLHGLGAALSACAGAVLLSVSIARFIKSEPFFKSQPSPQNAQTDVRAELGTLSQTLSEMQEQIARLKAKLKTKKQQKKTIPGRLLAKLYAEQPAREAAKTLGKLNPSVIFAVLENMPKEAAQRIVRHLSPEWIARVMAPEPVLKPESARKDPKPTASVVETSKGKEIIAVAPAEPKPLQEAPLPDLEESAELELEIRPVSNERVLSPRVFAPALIRKNRLCA